MLNRNRSVLYTAAAAAGLLCGALAAHAQARFDHVVRNDFFAGLMGDKAALDRGMKKCEEVLKENPNHAEALVWHGAGVFGMAGEAFRTGDQTKGMELYTKAMAEMDRAVSLEPDNIGVRIPRGASVLSAARAMPEEVPVRKELLERGLSDHQRAYELQESRLDQLGTHPLGELLSALADAHSRLGNPEKAEFYYDLVLAKLKDTPYGKRAIAWKQTRQPLPLAETMCIGCHVPSK
jgi:tetratricopeptide (TPR) repeat protein